MNGIVSENQEQSEETCKAILENIPLSIAFLDRDFRYIKVNKQHERWSGKCESELLGRHCYDIVGQYRKDTEREGSDRICDGCGTRLAFETGKIQKYIRDFRDVTLEVTTVPVFDKDGSVNRFIEIVRDITLSAKKRRQITKRLEESEEKYHRLWEKSSDGIFIAQDDAFRLTNPSFRRMLGYGEAELYSMNYLGLVTPGYREHIQELYEEIMNGNSSIHRIENELLTKEGETIQVELTTVPLHFEGRLAVLGVVRDVTELRSYTREIESGKRYLESLLHSIRDVVISTDSSRNIISCNEAVERVFGYAEKELVSKSFSSLRSEEHRNRSIRLGSPALKALMETGYYFDDNYEFKRKNGEIFPASFSASVIRDTGGNNIGLVGIIRDETGRKQVEQAFLESEERYRKIVENSSDIIWITDFNGTPVFANNACSEKLGYGTGRDRAPLDLVHPDDRQYLKENMDRLIWEKSSLRNVTCRFKNRYGQWLDLIINAERVSLGGKEYIQCVARDISEIKEAERLKSEFIANMSHELRTPLNAIIGYTKILLNSTALKSAPEQEKQLSLIRKNGEKLLAMINDLLDISIIESGRMSVTIEKFQVRGVVEDVVDAFRPAFDCKSLAVDYQVEDIEMFNDRQKMVQIMTNLVDNAIKYTERGSVSITARCTDDYQLSLSVADTGIGIKKENLRGLFRAFYQIDGSTTRKHGGVGIGLHLTKRLSELMGGSIGVASEPDVGSVFTATLPIIYRGRVPDRKEAVNG